MISRDNDIANELRELIPDAEWTGLRPAAGVAPAGYFEQLPGLILQKVRAADVQDELEMLSPSLAPIPKTFPLSVPPHYFQQLSVQISTQITADAAEEELPSILADMPTVFPMSAPIGYFDQLPGQLLQKIHSTGAREELIALSSLLAEASRTMPQSVPAGYFDQLSTNVMAGISEASAAAAVPTSTVVRRMNSNRYVKWTVAASLIALVSLSTLLFVREHQSSGYALETTLATVSDQEIMEYLQSHMDAFDKEELASYPALAEERTEIPVVDELPAEAIQHYLDNTGLLKERLTDN
jgi:hypothetical protein